MTGRLWASPIVSGKSMKILIVGPSWVGDMVMAQTLFQCLKQRHPDCQIDVLAPEWSRPILERMPEVRQALSFPLGHGALELATRRRIGKSLAGQYDQAILLPNSLKSVLIPFLAGIPERIGFTGEARYGLINRRHTLDEAALPQMAERFAQCEIFAVRIADQIRAAKVQAAVRVKQRVLHIDVLDGAEEQLVRAERKALLNAAAKDESHPLLR